MYNKVSAQIEQAVSVPFIHIADATACAITANGSNRVGLLGTAYTMEQDFYKGRLEHEHGLEVLVPEKAGREVVHDIIFNELVMGEVKEKSRLAYEDIMRGLVDRGAEGVILGCTEIGMLVRPDEDANRHSPVVSLQSSSNDIVKLPLYDTTELHANAAVKLALSL